jgi:Ser/Thr protein kinase RdoA (MazF antagonist)
MPSEIAYELELLAHLAAKGVPVSLPISGHDGALVRPLAAPEGTRHLVLFAYARGTPLSWDKEEPTYRAGQLLAAIHAASDDFTSPYARFRWDLEYMIDMPLAAIRQFLSHRPEDWRYLEGLATRLRARVLAAAEAGLDWGICHGDLAGKNIHVAEDNTLTVFDFDNCGSGWRAYDLAVVLWGMMYLTNSTIWASFLRGYTEVRRLAAVDLAAVSLFCAISHLWVLGIRANRVAVGCSVRISDWSFDRELTFFREWEAKYIEGK